MMAGTAEVTNSVFCKPNKLPSSFRFSRARPVASVLGGALDGLNGRKFLGKNAEISANFSRNSVLPFDTRSHNANANSRVSCEQNDRQLPVDEHHHSCGTQ